MLEPYEWKQVIFPELIQSDEFRDIYYKVCCYYNAETEIYDRCLGSIYGYTTFEKYDNTSVCLTQSYAIKYSRSYAQDLFNTCKNILVFETHKAFDWSMWKLVNNKIYKAQSWIDEYKRLKSNGELDFINKYI